MRIQISNTANITSINCGTSTPKLRGFVDLSVFPNLIVFNAGLNDIQAIPSLNNNPALTELQIPFNNTSGSIPSLNNNINLRSFNCSGNLLTGSIPSLSANTSLRFFYCFSNPQLTGSIPSLNNNTLIQDFRCNSCNLSGPIPSLGANTALRVLDVGFNPQLSGSIPSLNNNTSLQYFHCGSCFNITGSIPSLSSNTSLTNFYCFFNKLNNFAGGSVSNTLGDFQAQNNDLPSSAVNAILAAFVAANRTTGTRILNLGGTGNAAPTGQGITDKATLISRGWTVTTN